MSKANFLEKQFNRTHLSKRDFEEADEYLRCYQKRLRSVTKRALLFAAIVSYARPFTKNSEGVGHRATSLLSANPKALLIGAEWLLHLELLELRDELLAHSDFDRKPMRRVRGTGSGFVVKAACVDLLAEQIDVKFFRAVCKKMIRHAVNRLFTLNREIVAE